MILLISGEMLQVSQMLSDIVFITLGSMLSRTNKKTVQVKNNLKTEYNLVRSTKPKNKLFVKHMIGEHYILTVVFFLYYNIGVQ